jgi:hypothetical protein
MPSPNLSFRTPQSLLEQIQRRDLKGVENPGAVAKRDVERWYGLLQEALSEVRLSPAEAVVLIHYVGALQNEPVHSNILLAAQTIGSTSLGLGDAFAAVRASLAAKMASWSLAGKYAAWDAAERYEVLAVRGPETLTFGMALHEVGLHTYDLPTDELATIERMAATTADQLPGEYLVALEDNSE